MRHKKSRSRFGENRIPTELNYFRLPIFDHFHGRPVHVRTVEKDMDMVTMCDDLSHSLLRSEMEYDPSPTEEEPISVRRLLLRLAKDVFVYVEPYDLNVYASTPELALKYAMELSARYPKP